MPHHPQRARRRNWARTLLMLCFLLAAAAGCMRCFVRKPQLTPPPDESAASSPAQSASSAAVSAEPAPVDERKSDFYTILVSGVDDGNGGSDTNILVAFDAGGKAIHCMSIPRDTGVFINGSAHKVNAAYNKGGMSLLASTVSDALGIPVDFTVEVKLRGFVRLVDAIGGVDFNVPIHMDYDDPIQDLSIHFSKGMQHLTGQEALEVVRFRHNNDGSGYGSEDLGRIDTQQAFLKAVAKQTLTLSNVDKIGQFAQIFSEDVATQLSVGELAWLGTEAISIGTDALRFSTLPGEWSGRRSLYLVDQAAVLETVNASMNPYTTPRTAEDLDFPA